MPISSAEFGERLEAGTAAITLVGMSNVGKSWTAKALEAEKGFERIDCDGEIMKALGIENMDAMAEWLGQPYSEGFETRQSIYLQEEWVSLAGVLRRTDKAKPSQNLVIDTTGSVVHTGQAIRDALGQVSTVVAIVASESHNEEMFKKYMAEPKPVVWGDFWRPRANETNETALARCYPALTAYRRPLYEAMAHVCIPMEVSHDFTGPDEFLAHVQEALPA